MRQLHTAGMAWFKRENYLRLLEIFEDSENLHDTYDEWLESAEQVRRTLKGKGVRVTCVDIDPDEFPKWCAENGFKLNGKARSEYAVSTQVGVSCWPIKDAEVAGQVLGENAVLFGQKMSLARPAPTARLRSRKGFVGAGHASDGFRSQCQRPCGRLLAPH
tara:strand:- start:23790 stop:24272 length:483 start_codon:yes stop_codon:yes gene_type:complete